jgi:hypothetical protein
MITSLIFGPYGSLMDRIVRKMLVAYAAGGQELRPLEPQFDATAWKMSDADGSGMLFHSIY